MGLALRRLFRSRIIVVIGATTRIGKATIHSLSQHHNLSITIVAATETTKDERMRRLKDLYGVYLQECNFQDPSSLRKLMHMANAVLLVPTQSEYGTRLARRVIDACEEEDVERLVICSSILANDDTWRNDQPYHLGYEAIEAHARSKHVNAITLRIPLIMDSLLYCRDDILYGTRVVGCFQEDTKVPCIALSDVALATSEVLVESERKYDRLYTLAHHNATCSPRQLARLLSEQLGREMRYAPVDDQKFDQLMKEKGVNPTVVNSIKNLRTFLESPVAGGDEDQRRGIRNRVGFSDDFQRITKLPLKDPEHWLEDHLPHFQQTLQNQVQLFVLGADDPLFVSISELINKQLIQPPANSSIGATGTPSGQGSRVSLPALFRSTQLCTIKGVSSGVTQTRRQRPQSSGVAPPQFQLPGRQPVTELLQPLTSQDVILLIPPLHFGIDECLSVVRKIVQAAEKAKVWGVVFVSSIFCDLVWNDEVNRLGDMEKCVTQSSLPHTIVRLPIFMEYFAMLSYPPAQATTRSPLFEKGVDDDDDDDEVDQEEKAVEPVRENNEQQQQRGTPNVSWMLSEKSLDGSVQYLMAVEDAALALITVALRFPLHKNQTRTVFTDAKTMSEIETILSSHLPFGVDFSRVDALHEDEARRPFWHGAYWTRNHMKQFLECSVQISAMTKLSPSVPYEELTNSKPQVFAEWVCEHADVFVQTR